ncbi:hypothetical protein [Deinococcus multiflagellatus]|uniref:Uncharacterized protein n=1 Tax=Deinococcus multiflagellatus TaxID=1656887 RepID=A0ABW1ZF50_9DEIO
MGPKCSRADSTAPPGPAKMQGMSRSLPLLRGVRALLVLALLGALGLAAAQAAPTAALRPALSGEQRTLSLPGFGAVAYTADPGGPGARWCCCTA